MNLRTLSGVAQTLTVVTTAAVATDVSAHYEDQSIGTQMRPTQPGNVNTAITTATTTTILSAVTTGADPQWTVRVLKALSIRNKGASPQTVTVNHVGANAAGTAVTAQLKSVTLPAGGELHWTERSGWAIPAGEVAGTQIATATADTPNSAADTLANVAGLTLPVTAGDTYHFRAVIDYTADATTSGSRWTVNGPAVTRLAYTSVYALTTTTQTNNHGLTAYQLPAAANVSSAATGGNVAVIEGYVTPSADGNLVVQSAAEAGTITAKAGSHLTLRKMIDV